MVLCSYYPHENAGKLNKTYKYLYFVLIDNMTKRFFKKGISPLIATLLLISTAVAVGTSIMSWGIAFYGEKKLVEDGEFLCGDIGLEVNKVDNRQQICYDKPSSTIEFTITNKGAIKVESFIMWIVGRDMYTTDLNEGINPGYPLKKKMNYDFSTYGDIKQVHFIPKIKKDNEENQITCSNKKLVLEKISPC